ncbi:MAG: glycosyltransferase family 4 protein [Anaerolineales bacterium]|nr:glycosyltransferase family 4 protein [Anaerolineales bacterium]
MRILNSLYYYRPHYSGLTVYTERLARHLAARGHDVTVLTSRYDPDLPSKEQVDGVSVRRLPVMLKVSKGPIMPTLVPNAIRLLGQSDILHLHVPQLDAAPLALLGRLYGVPVVLTYHCDLRLPDSTLNRIAGVLSALANRISVALADVVVVNTRDYAEESDALAGVLHKVEVIPPPIEIPRPAPQRQQALKDRLGLIDGQPVIGMAARLASEKGAEYLAQALPIILERHPGARVLYVGQYEDVLGEEEYGLRLAPILAELGDHWTFLGILDAEDLAAFFSICSVTVLPSLNSTESFGMVQVEAMLCGTPVVASDLPGVRQPTAVTGMGITVPPRDPAALAEAILEILARPERFIKSRDEVAAHYSADVIAEAYQALFQSLTRHGDQK